MANLRAFKGFRPKKEFAARIASFPYDVINSSEARELVQGNDLSFLRVVKPEVDLPPDTDLYSEEVYQKGLSNLQEMISEGIFKQDEDARLYVYAQTMNGKTQYGMVGCAHVLDYLNNAIKRHELTRPDKEEDRKKHIRVSGFHAEPVFFVHPTHLELDEIVAGVSGGTPEYDFTAEDGIRHQFWVMEDGDLISRVENIFATRSL